MPASDQAIVERRDYVANSNDSYWLTNPKSPYRVLSPILGTAEVARSLRTRSGLIEIDRRLTGTDGFTITKVDHETARAMQFANKTLAAELTLETIGGTENGSERTGKIGHEGKSEGLPANIRRGAIERSR